MTVPVPLEDMDLTEVTLTRRVPVMEHRAKGWGLEQSIMPQPASLTGRFFPPIAYTMTFVMCCFAFL